MYYSLYDILTKIQVEIALNCYTWDSSEKRKG